MSKLNRTTMPIKKRAIKVVQFGEGNFLRAFADWIIQDLNDKGIFCGNVAVVQPVEKGRVAELAEQDGLYTVLLEGLEDGKKVQKMQVIDVISEFINPYTQWEKYLELAKNPDLEIVISNTTEAGIVLDKNDLSFDSCPKSFPTKLLAFLYQRYLTFNGAHDKGLGIIACELIDYNADELKRILIELSYLKKLSPEFLQWLCDYNHFTNTLVDRIVPGYPRDRIEQIQEECGYRDDMLVACEVFHLWVMQQNPFIQAHFPADKTGKNVIFAPDITPYKQQKVKILNGSHTAIVPIAYLMGLDTVREAVENKYVRKYLNDLIYSEIIPTIDLEREKVESFAKSVIGRFENPFIRHELMSIALNSTTKFVTRLLPSINDYMSLKKYPPQRLAFAFAALIAFHRGKRGEDDICLVDSPENLSRWNAAWNTFKDEKSLLKTISEWTDIWGSELSLSFIKLTTEHLHSINELGMEQALKNLLERL